VGRLRNVGREVYGSGLPYRISDRSPNFTLGAGHVRVKRIAYHTEYVMVPDPQGEPTHDTAVVTTTATGDDGHGNLDAGGHEAGRWRPPNLDAGGHEIWTPPIASLTTP
jgi:hypothetical protein